MSFLRGVLAAIGLCAALGAQQRITVATHYFYWYKWPTEHFDQPGAPGREGHARHFADPERVDYESAAWHRANFSAMASCDIDVALPVYWGAPGAYDRPGIAFSRRGLPAMVEALDAMRRDGAAAVELGLFYDTSTLRNDVRGAAPREGRADLTTDAGRTLFCTTVTDYFAAIPKHYWARHRGGALVVLYVSAFAARWDASLGDALREAFAARFPGETVCLVADVSWGDVGQDLTTAWGAALHGPKLFPGVAQIGPGYDDRPVPGRRTPIREREDGAFYAFSWQRALRHRPELVLLETWNEMHEGTELCATLELGDRYERLTEEWIAKLRSGAEPGEPIALRWPGPRPRPDRSWGEEAARSENVSCDYSAETPKRFGLRELPWEDGPLRIADGALRAAPAGEQHGYLYFRVSDHFAFDGDAVFTLEIWHDGESDPDVHFDAVDREARPGSYARCPPSVGRRDGEWRVASYRLERARFANRQNGGADFRIALPTGRGAVRRIELRRAAE